MTLDFAPPPPGVTRIYRAAIEAHKAALNSRPRLQPPSLHSSARLQSMTVDPDEAQAARYEADRRIADFASQL